MLSGIIGTAGTAVNTAGSNLTIDSDAQFVSGSDNNIAIGVDALNSTTTNAADYNIAIGTSALTAVTTGGSNIGIGHNTGAALLGKTGNIGIGTHSLVSATCNDSISIGYYAMSSAAAQTGTIAIGSTALQSLTSGQKNIAIGYQALKEHISGSNNIAIGDGAMNGTRSGDASYTTSAGSSNNIFIGKDSGGGNWNNYDASGNVCIGSLTMDGALYGAANNVCIGNEAGGAITHAHSCVYVGAYAGDGNDDGYKNVAVGYGALSDNADDENVAIGYNAGMSNTGGNGFNVFIGSQAADVNTGDYNTVVGAGALGTATAVNKTVAIGNQALFSANDDSADGTVAIGWSTGYYSVPTGDATDAGNTLIGYSVGTDVSGGVKGLTTGVKNTAVGQQALGSNAGAALTGNNNTTLGYRAGYGLVGAANDNTFVGHDSGETVTSGTNNTLVGSTTATSAVGGTNQIVIGYDATGVGDNTAIIGNSSVTDVYMGDNGSTWSTTSDGRLKENVKSWKTGLAEIKKLNIVSYNFKKDNPYGYDTKKVRQGIIAQEAVNAIPEMIDTSKEWMSANQEPMIWALVNAVQELSQQIEDLKKG